MERPILLNTDMVKATLEDRKTNTRRIVKPQPKQGYRIDKIDGKFLITREFENLKRDEELIGVVVGEINPPCQVGDILWIRETWLEDSYVNDWFYVYKASQPEYIEVTRQSRLRWKPSIFMPRAAARIFLKVTNVRVERLEDISEEDAIREGMRVFPSGYVMPGSGYDKAGLCHTHASIAFRVYWSELYPDKTGEHPENPWVWVIEFEKV